MVVDARCTGLSVFFHTPQFPVCIKNGPPPKGHPVNLTQLWEVNMDQQLCGDNMDQHACGMLSTPCRFHALTN
jgi:hypothetical protein